MFNNHYGKFYPESSKITDNILMKTLRVFIILAYTWISCSYVWKTKGG